MNQNPRITLNDSVQDILKKLSQVSNSDGYNPGALQVCMGLFRDSNDIDPLAQPMSGLMNLLALDDMGIYAEKIWVLAKNVCGGRVDNLALLLRSRQLGFITEARIHAAISAFSLDCFDFSELAAKVKDEIETFNWPYESTHGMTQA